MNLDNIFEKFDEKTERLIWKVIVIGSFGYNLRVQGDFPEISMVIGDNWYYMATGAEKSKNIQEELNRVHIEPRKVLMENSHYKPLREILKENLDYFDNEIAMFPFTNFRENEIKEWGIKSLYKDFIYSVQFLDKRLIVFSMADIIHGIR